MRALNPSETRLELRGQLNATRERILTPEALAFLEDLCARFAGEIDAALSRRVERRGEWQAGKRLDFLTETEGVRRADWRVGTIPEDLQCRTVEITGPVDRKMVINALNSGADTFMADCEDSSSPTWAAMIDGQVNLADAVRRTIAFEDPARGKSYALQSHPAVLLVRPRGLHLKEAHVLFDGQPIPACLFDFGLYLFHNARTLIDRGSGPYFYLPKLESHLEARLWNAIFVQAQEWLDLPVGTIKATVLIETLPAAFEMDEILWELREHIVGLNCGRWDYIFSFIKVHRWDAAMVLPDRAEVSMLQPCMRAYTQLCVRTCHRRGALAIGGMAAQIPIKNDPAANGRALDQVREDKLREVRDGHDGTWVAHPALVEVARDAFALMVGDNQLHQLREDVYVTAADLLELPEGERTDAGLRLNLRVGVQYLAAWLAGNGCVPLNHLMEDAATAEISRAQVWQWLRHGARFDDGTVVDEVLFSRTLREEMAALRGEIGAEGWAAGRYDDAIELFDELCRAEEMPEFLTTYAYDRL